MNTQVIPMKRLTKKEIAEGMKAVPIERIILGATSANGIKLTKKQKAFAESVVATGNKSEAYRLSHDTKGKRTTVASEANKLSKNPNVATYILALEAHKEVEEYLLPARLRSMAIHKLSSMALNDALPPAQQLKALELVGKMSDVQLFSERREVVHSLDSSVLKAKLLEAVQLAIANSKNIRQSTKRTAQELLAEISEPVDVESREVQEEDKEEPSVPNNDGDGIVDGISPTPHTPTAQFFPSDTAGHLHSNPDKEFRSNPSTLTGVRVEIPLESDTSEALRENPKGEGVSNLGQTPLKISTETPPISNWVENDGGVVKNV